MKVILLIFSFCILVFAWMLLKSSGTVSGGTNPLTWLQSHTSGQSFDLRLIGIGALFALPVLLWLIRKRD
jgi:hypothetical protein